MDYIEASNLLEVQKKLPVKEQNQALITSAEIYLGLLVEEASKRFSFISRSIPNGDQENHV